MTIQYTNYDPDNGPPPAPPDPADVTPGPPQPAPTPVFVFPDPQPWLKLSAVSRVEFPHPGVRIGAISQQIIEVGPRIRMGYDWQKALLCVQVAGQPRALLFPRERIGRME